MQGDDHLGILPGCNQMDLELKSILLFRVTHAECAVPFRALILSRSLSVLFSQKKFPKRHTHKLWIKRAKMKKIFENWSHFLENYNEEFGTDQ